VFHTLAFVIYIKEYLKAKEKNYGNSKKKKIMETQKKKKSNSKGHGRNSDGP